MLISLNFVTSFVDIKININDGFRVGEQIKFDYIFTPEVDEEIIYNIQLKCVDGYESMLFSEKINLQANSPVTKTYEGFVVEEEMAKQQCLAIVKTKSPFTKVKEEVFTIATLPMFSFEIKICENADCSEESKVFIQGGDVYLDYIADVEDVSLDVVLISPDGKRREINLPKQIGVSQIGGYGLEVTASKEGYKNLNLEEQFSVIEKHAEVKTLSVSEGDEDEGIKGASKGFFIFVGFIFILVVVMVVILYFLSRMREKTAA